MALDPFSSTSVAKQTNYNVSDAGQLNQRGSKVAQGNGILLDHTNIGGTAGRDIKVGRNGQLVINEGVGSEDLANLSSLFTDSISKLGSDSAAAAAANSKAITDTIGKVVGDSLSKIGELAADRQATDPNASPLPQLTKTFLWLALGGLGLLAWIWVRKK